MSIQKQCLRNAQYLCANCGNDAHHAHHVVPLSVGGNDILSNLIALCDICHGLVHDQKFVNHSFLTKQGLAKAKANGKKLGGLRPNTIKANNDRRKRNLQKAWEYREILTFRKQGLSYRQIADLLEKQQKLMPSGNVKWHSSVVHRLHMRLLETQEVFLCEDKQQ